MIVAKIAAVIVGTVVVMSVLISALETVVLPRGFTHIGRFAFAVADRVLIHRWGSRERRTTSAPSTRPSPWSVFP